MAGAVERGSGWGRGLQQLGKGEQSGSRSRGQGTELQTRPRRAPPPAPDDATCRTAPAGGDAPGQGEGTGSRPGWRTGFLFDWEDLPNLKGVRAGGVVAPRSLLKQLVRFRPF